MEHITYAKLAGIAIMLLGLCIVLGGCKSSAAVSIYQSAISCRTGIQASTACVKTNVISKDVGRSIYVAGQSSLSALKELNTQRLAGTTNLNAYMSAAVAAINNLATQVNTLPATKASSTSFSDHDAAVDRALSRLDLRNLRPLVTASSANKPGIGEAELAQIIIVAVQQIPTLVNWINAAINTSSVTDAQIATELAGLESDLAALALALSVE